MQSVSQNVWEEQLWPSDLYGPLGLSKSQLSIRLLRLKPGKPGDPIKCKLFRTTVISSPPYEALSYTWGDPASRSTVCVNGIEVSVTRNLCKALRTLRYENRARVLWVDALCINQHDTAERSSQVQEMGNIYSFADGVLVWLDCLSEYQDAIMGAIRDSAIDSICSTLDSLEIGLLKRSSAAKLSAISLRASEGLLHIFDNPYWGRVWVVQEVSRARRDPTIAIGYGKEFKLSSLKNVVQALHLDPQPDDSNLWTVVSIRDRTRTPPRLRDADTEDPTPETARKHLSEDLLYLLDSTRYFKSTDPRDKIFALWTLVRGTGERRFTPDYSMSMQQVYTAVTSEIIEGLGTLRVLMFRRASSRISDLPTWVPDYSLTPAPFLSMPSPAALQVSDLNNAFVPPKTDSSNKNRLLVRGAVIDTVSEVLSISPFISLEGRGHSFKRERALRESKLDELANRIRQLQERNKDSGHDNLSELHEYLARMTKNHKTMTEDQRSSLSAVPQIQRQYAHAIIGFARALVANMGKTGFVPDSNEEVCRLGRKCYTASIESVDEAYRSLNHPTLSGHFLSSATYDDGNDDHNGVDDTDSAPLLIDDSLRHAWRIIQAHDNLAFMFRSKELDVRVRDFDSIFETQLTKVFGFHQYHRNRPRVIKGLEKMGIDWWTHVKDFALRPYDQCEANRERLVRDLRVQFEWNIMAQNLDRRNIFTIQELMHIPQDMWDSFDLFVQGVESELRVLRKTRGVHDRSATQLYRTTSGLTGFGSEDLRVGDHVAVLDGLPSVCIIRKSEAPHAAPNEYTFHGSTFFNGAESATPEPLTLTYAPLVLV
jgi:hypothetical protein